MGKKSKIGKLRYKIACKIERVMCLLNKIMYADNTDVEKTILAGIAYDEVKRMDNFNQKIYKYL